MVYEHLSKIIYTPNEAYPDFDKARDWLVLFSPRPSISETVHLLVHSLGGRKNETSDWSN